MMHSDYFSSQQSPHSMSSLNGSSPGCSTVPATPYPHERPCPRPRNLSGNIDLQFGERPLSRYWAARTDFHLHKRVNTIDAVWVSITKSVFQSGPAKVCVVTVPHDSNRNTAETWQWCYHTMEYSRILASQPLVSSPSDGSKEHNS